MRDYNFFSIYEKQRELRFNPKSLYFTGAVILLLSAILSAGVITNNLLLSNSIQKMESQLNTLKATEDYQLASQLQNSMVAMADYEKNGDIAWGNFQSANFVDSQLLADIFKGIPTSASVVYIDIEAYDFKLTCRIPDRDAGAELLLGLKETKLFRNVQLETIELDQNSNTYVVRVYGNLKVGEAE